MRGKYPAGAARKTLAQILKDFVASTGADMKSVDIIDTDGTKMSILDFVKQVDNTNDLPRASLLKNVFKNSKVIAEEVLPKVQKYQSDLKWHSGADPVRITLDLRTARVKQKDSNNIVIGQGAANPQDMIDQNRGVSKTGKAPTVDDNGTTQIKYDEKWLVKVLMNDLGYEKVV